VQIAPSGMMKKRKEGFSIVVVPVWRLVNDWFTRRFFPVDVVNCFIGFVATIRSNEPRPGREVEIVRNLLITQAFQVTPPDFRRRRP
jgi:hypothetical protein